MEKIGASSIFRNNAVQWEILWLDSIVSLASTMVQLQLRLRIVFRCMSSCRHTVQRVCHTGAVLLQMLDQSVVTFGVQSPAKSGVGENCMWADCAY